MKKIKIIVLIVCLYILCGCSNRIDNYPESINNNESNFVDELFDIAINEEEIIETINNLTDSSREWGSDGEKSSYKFLSSKLQEYGYETSLELVPVYAIKEEIIVNKKFENFFPNNSNQEQILGYATNVVGKKKNGNTSDKKIFLTAHYDSVKEGYGVIDNASGVSALLEIARQLQNLEVPYDVEIIFFSAEEYHLTGSKGFVNQLNDSDVKNSIGCINIDMIGEKNAGDIVMKTTNGMPNIITEMIMLNVDEDIRLKSGGSSDEVSFLAKGIPAVTISQENPNYSIAREKDEMRYLDLTGIEHVVEVVMKCITQCNYNEYQTLLQQKNIISYKEEIDNEIKTNPYIINNKLDGFDIVSIENRLVGNGITTEKVYCFSNKESASYVISQIPIAYAAEVNLDEFRLMDLEIHPEVSIYVPRDNNCNIKIIIEGYQYQIIVKGDISIDQALNLSWDW